MDRLLEFLGNGVAARTNIGLGWNLSIDDTRNRRYRAASGAGPEAPRENGRTFMASANKTEDVETYRQTLLSLRARQTDRSRGRRQRNSAEDKLGLMRQAPDNTHTRTASRETDRSAKPNQPSRR